MFGDCGQPVAWRTCSRRWSTAVCNSARSTLAAAEQAVERMDGEVGGQFGHPGYGELGACARGRRKRLG